jgi:hypothetical protein
MRYAASPQRGEEARRLGIFCRTSQTEAAVRTPEVLSPELSQRLTQGETSVPLACREATPTRHRGLL